MQHFIAQLITIAEHASSKILQWYAQENISIVTKTDGSPVTQADLDANEIIVNGLTQLAPHIPIISEELPEMAFSERQNWDQFWLIDPLDGTRQFIKRGQEFAINIALIQHNYPVLGVIYIPVTQICYFAYLQGGAFKKIGSAAAQPIHIRPLPAKPHILTNHRQHENKLRAGLSMFSAMDISAVSSAIKYGLVADGSADFFPCFSPTSEWDTAAGQCIVEQAGGKVTDFSGERLRYNAKSSLINPHFVVMGDSEKLLPIVKAWGQA